MERRCDATGANAELQRGPTDRESGEKLHGSSNDVRRVHTAVRGRVEGGDTCIEQRLSHRWMLTNVYLVVESCGAAYVAMTGACRLRG
jgi:hypothetical protein